ncbi:uncharacterized protein LOC106672169 isoform X2 [Cimex lectularius]|nr:uncharacterized protein LOC106672169 isoform X2 [Cimex lectularius]
MSTKRVRVDDVRRFMKSCLTCVGAPSNHAQQLTDVLVAADVRGHFSHGLNRLEMYVRDIQNKTTDPSAEPTIVKETSSTALVNGNNGLGPVVGNFCMKLAINKASDAGIGWVVTKGSNHYGMAGWYSMQALEHGMMGFSFTNTSPLMSPTRSKGAALGTNPISFTAPAMNGDSFVLDMSTTTSSLGKIEYAKRKQEPIPNVWAQDDEGKPTTDPEVAFKTANLLPLGGREEHGGYKGYGLALMVEALCGISAGSHYGYKIRAWMGAGSVANLGQCFGAINPDCFETGFKERMSDMMSFLRNMPKADVNKHVLIPGDPERHSEQETVKNDGILYSTNQLLHYELFAKELGVEQLKSY